MRLSDHVAVVTGGGSGIGRAVALQFARDGAAVALVDVDADRAGAVLAEIAAMGARGDAFCCDVGKEDAVARAMGAIAASFGGIDILVNSAGIELLGLAEEMEEPAWDKLMDVNLKSMFLCSKHAIPSMRARGGGSIVNIASVLGIVAAPRHVAYCASKGGVLQFTKALGYDHAKDQIRVNCILPGPIDTPLYRSTIASYGDAEKMHERYRAAVPIGRLGQPDDIAKAAVFLCSDDALFITCTQLVVDGGFTASNMA